MPVVTFYDEHRSHDAEPGANLREFMRKIGISPYKGVALITNCRGHGLCGTCAVEVVEGKGASSRSQDEEGTLGGNLAIARVVDKNLRLACQTNITGDMLVKTHPVRPINRVQTRQRLGLIGIGAFFFLVFAGMFVFLFLDMIRKALPW